jgi:hypothetical protein
MTDIYYCKKDDAYITDFSDGSNHNAVVAFLLTHRDHDVRGITNYMEGIAQTVTEMLTNK